MSELSDCKMLDQGVTLTDVHNTCRACMNTNGVLYDIYNIYEEKQPLGPYQRLQDKIYYCTNIMIDANDGLPTKICQNCHSSLQSAYDFKTRFTKCDQIFKQTWKKNLTTLQNPFDDLLSKDAKLNNTDYLNQSHVESKDDISDYGDDNIDNSFPNVIELDTTVKAEEFSDDKFKFDVALKTELLPKSEGLLTDMVKVEKKIDAVDFDDDEDCKPLSTLKSESHTFKKPDCSNIVEKLSRFNGLKITKLSNDSTPNPVEPIVEKPPKKTSKSKKRLKKIEAKSEKKVKIKQESKAPVYILINSKMSKDLKDRLTNQARREVEKKNEAMQAGLQTSKPVKLVNKKTTNVKVVGKKGPHKKFKVDKEVVQRDKMKKMFRMPIVTESSPEEKRVCEHCGITVLRTSYHPHVRTHFAPKFACSYPNCTYRCWRGTSLKRHMLKHSDVRNHLCQKCPKSFKSSCQLRDHERIVHTEKERKFKCDYCTKSYYTMSCLKLHVNTSHSDTEAFRCEECHAGFTERQLWRKHMSKVHNIEVPFAHTGRKRNMLFE